MRCFISLELPIEIKLLILKILRLFKYTEVDLNWINPRQSHLTLIFLGDIDEIAIPILKDVLDKICFRVFAIKLAIYGCGIFPNFYYPRIIYLGLAGQLDELANLYKMIIDEISLLGIIFKDYHFIPHITLGRFRYRVKDKGDKLSYQHLSQLIRDFNNFISPIFIAGRISLIKSILTRQGPIYKLLYDRSLL